jgi:capsular exopolysaccharide synthesis family protein
MLSAFYRPKSIEAEAYRGIRTALYFSMRGENHKVIQITSPDMGDGKSTLISNLAVSIAQTGKKVLLVDADFRRPRIHKVFGITAKVGLASVINSETEIADAIRPTVIPNLSILPCGPHPDNPAELLTQPRFKELLDLLREQYDFVLIDTPPILAVTDPCVVVPHVNGVVLTIRIGKNVRMHATRAKEILSGLGANVLGVVVNEVNLNASSDYGYAGYRYGYGYTYKYYSGDKKNYAYREETPQEQPPTNGAADKPSGETAKQRSSNPERKTGFWHWLTRV